MKDARGHGSDGRGGGSSASDYLKRSQIGLAPGRGFSGKQLSGSTLSDTQRTVGRMREQLQYAGPGHSAGIIQGIKNFIGGR